MPTKFSRWQMFVLWFAANRRWIGGIVSFAGLILRFNLSFVGHDEWADRMKDLADLIIMGGGATASAGIFHSDETWEERKNIASLPPQVRPLRRRKNDAWAR